MAVDRDVGRGAEALAQRDERARQAETVERLRPQLECDPPHVLQPRPRELLDLREGLAGGRGLLGEMAETEQHRRQRLADLVMQFLGDPATLLLLAGQDHPRPLALRALQTRQHLVDRLDHRRDIRRARLQLQALIGVRQIDVRGESAQSLERTEHAPQQHEVDEHEGA